VGRERGIINALSPSFFYLFDFAVNLHERKLPGSAVVLLCKKNLSGLERF
jgi:hypothetical protein